MEKHLQKRIVEMTEQIELATEPDWIAWGLITRAAIYKEAGNLKSAVEDLTTAIALPKIPEEKLVEALRARSWIRQCASEYPAAIMDIEHILLIPNLNGGLKMAARLQHSEITHIAGVEGVSLKSPASVA